MKAHILKTGSLKKTGGKYALALLSAKNIDRILALQDAVINAMPREEQRFLLKKDKGFFERHFAAGNIVLGVLHDGELIAQSIVVTPAKKNPAKFDRTTVLQGVVVDPDYRGNSLMAVMVDSWLTLAKKQGWTDATANCAVYNHHSLNVFKEMGLQIRGSGRRSATDDTEIYSLHAEIAPAGKELKSGFNGKVAKGRVIYSPFAMGHQGIPCHPAEYGDSGTVPARENIKFSPCSGIPDSSKIAHLR